MAEGGGPACGGGQQHPPPAAPQQWISMNWSHFKPEFSGKPDKDVEAHLLRTNDWMTTHDFPEAVKVQRFCLTLVGEARNWYATLEPVVMTWPELQTMFRHQYSKIGNTREQLFQAWRSFHYDENVEMPDAYCDGCPLMYHPYGGVTNQRPILLAGKSVQPQAGVKLGGKGFSLSRGTSLAEIKASTS